MKTGKASEAHRKALGQWLGSRDPEHIRRWVAGQNAGKERAIKCVAISKTTGTRCGHVPRRGADKCHFHLKGKALDKVEQAHISRMADWYEAGSPAQRAQARKALARVARRQLFKLWRMDPRKQAETLTLDDYTYKAVSLWLKQNSNLDIEQRDFLTGRELSPRCIDRLKWAAYRVIRRGREATPDFINNARRRVGLALKEERAWWIKYDREGGDD